MLDAFRARAVRFNPFGMILLDAGNHATIPEPLVICHGVRQQLPHGNDVTANRTPKLTLLRRSRLAAAEQIAQMLVPDAHLAFDAPVGSGASRFFCERQRRGVDAVTQAGGFRPVIENMAEMRVAAGATDFVARHEMTGVSFDPDGFLGYRLIETRPAGAALEFRVRAEQRCAAAHTAIDTGLVIVPQLAGEGDFRTPFAGYSELFRRQLLPPFLFRLVDFLHGDDSCALSGVVELNEPDR